MTSKSADAPDKAQDCFFVATAFEVELSLVDVAGFSGLQELEEQVSDKLYVRQLLATLTPREERVVRLRFGLGDYPVMTLKSMSEEMGLTVERVRQIEMKARRKMKFHAEKSPLRLPGTDIDQLRGYSRRPRAATSSCPPHFLRPCVDNPPPNSTRVMTARPAPHQCPQREPQFRHSPPPLTPWPRHIASLAAWLAPFAHLDLLLGSPAARTWLFGVIGPLPTAALVLAACQLILIPLVVLQAFGSRERMVRACPSQLAAPRGLELPTCEGVNMLPGGFEDSLLNGY
jgi:hypothetical protein